MLKKIKIQIKTFTGTILFEYESEDNTIRKTMEKGVKTGAYLTGADLTGAYLTGADLRGADLRGAYLRGADLRDADLRGADLRDADLRDAGLRDADLRDAYLTGADLRGAYLRGAYLRGADLRDADLRDAGLRDADLRDAYLTGADLKTYRSDINILRYQTGKLKAFKYLGENMISPYQSFKYEVGKTYNAKKVDENELQECGEGLNVASLEWCMRDTGRCLEKVYIEVEFNAKDIVAIPYFSDGKFRVSKLKVLRIIPKEELIKLFELEETKEGSVK